MNKKVVIFIVIIILVIGAIGTSIYFLMPKSENTKTVVKKSTNNIEGYGYTLDNLDTELYKEEFKILKDNLNSDDVNLEEYAKSIAKLFIIDVYTINNKINKYDVGGLEFLLESNKENFATNIEDTLYKYLEDNTNGKRDQELPEVKSIEVSNIESTKFTLKEDGTLKAGEYDAYKVSLKWDYVTDMGYDTEGTVIVLKNDNILYVVEKD